MNRPQRSRNVAGRTGQANMLSQELKSRRKNRRSLLSPYEGTKKHFRTLKSLSMRRRRREAALQDKLKMVKETTAAVSERLVALFDDDFEGKSIKERQKQFTVAINRTLNQVNAMEEICKDIEEIQKKEEWDAAKKSLVGLGTQLVDQIEEHERTTESWMKIQFNVDMTTTGSGIAKLPGSIAYSSFTVHDPPFDHMDVRNASFASKSSK